MSSKFFIKDLFCLMICCVFFVQIGCAPKTGLDKSQKDIPAPAQEQISASKAVAKISTKEGKTIITLPIALDIDVSPYIDDEKLALSFVPSITPFVLPAPDGIVSKAFWSLDKNGLASELNIILSKPAQFLLSRSKDGLLQILLVSQNEKANSSALGSSVEDNLPENHVGRIHEIEFLRNKQGNLFVYLKGKGPFEIIPEKSGPQKIVLFIPECQVDLEYAKLFRLNKFNTEVRSVFVQNVKKGVKLSFAVENKVPMHIDSDVKRLSICFLTSEQQNRSIDKSEGQVKITQKEDVQNAEVPELSALLPGMKKEYTGKKISIDLQDADIEHVLRLIAAITKYNLIIDEDVKGKISLRLYDIPWDQALDLVLLQKNLGMVLKGNIMRIATAAKLEAEREQLRKAREAALRARESIKNLEPLKREYIQINYATAAQLEPKVKEFLSPRGKITFDERTNQLIVLDTASNLEQIRSVVEKLDRPERQVLIEARIVYATDDFKRSLGLKWGIANTGEYFHQDRFYKQYNVSGLNFPALGPLDFSVGGSIAKVLGKDLFTLDAELKVGETKNISKTISAPRVITLNNQRAEIIQGTKIATTAESNSGGTTVEYKDATLKLSVLPQVTPDNKLILDIDIRDDSPVAGGGGDIETKSTKTKLIVNDGETIVIGGVKKISQTTADTRVPLLADIPVLGWLFKNKYKGESQQELLIFIRPKILD
ncbi:type IV pilus secretin PilQ [Desulfovulcanus sp.]